MDARPEINAAKQKSADAASRPERSRLGHRDPAAQVTRDDYVPGTPLTAKAPTADANRCTSTTVSGNGGAFQNRKRLKSGNPKTEHAPCRERHGSTRKTIAEPLAVQGPA
ncbi:MAG: hypothetical protein OXC54_01820 [Rhodospirillaceae bacterium]|nr:hypothetical protein [Rhodospirillaceae bacterium]MCY4310042.1 hypothetical protein [Rhodospirillaceae bacterium]